MLSIPTRAMCDKHAVEATSRCPYFESKGNAGALASLYVNDNYKSARMKRGQGRLFSVAKRQHLSSSWTISRLSICPSTEEANLSRFYMASR